MIQEIIVWVLFISVIGYYLYRTFISKSSSKPAGCAKCVGNKEIKQHHT